MKENIPVKLFQSNERLSEPSVTELKRKELKWEKIQKICVKLDVIYVDYWNKNNDGI